MKQLKLITVFLFSLFICQAQSNLTKGFEELKIAKTEGSKTKATQILQKLEKEFPNNADVLFENGLFQYTANDDGNAAIRYFAKALQINPDHASALLGRSKVYSEKGLYDRAIDDITRVIKIDSKNHELKYWRAEYYFFNKEYEKSLADYISVTEKIPLYLQAYVGAGNMFLKSNNPAGADQLYKNAMLVKGADILALQCYYGKLLMEQKRFEEAKKQFIPAMATNSDRLDGEDYNNAGIVYYKTKDNAIAAKYFEKAMLLSSKNVEYKINRASVAIDEFDWKRVLEIAKQAIELEPDNPMANMIMAVGLIKTGTNEKLGKEYEEKANRLGKEQGIK